MALDRGSRDRAIEALVDALRDGVPKVRLAAASALGRARAKESAGALEALARRLPRQDEVKVRRVLLDLTSEAPESAKKADLDELEDQLRRLRAKVEDLEAKLGAKGSPAGT
ncbi:MAG: HEAT repeat domain-containing protein [Polyangiaceae bacterium]|nr:HEAT repeat domain-containing protein [Polyangiaceae bacterium]